jgi:RNA polymerase sigma-70 factor (ECF subfamily)
MAKGDEDAFRQFHEAYFHRLLRYLFVVTRGDEDAARDALQDTFTRVARHIRPFEEEDALWGWLTLIARSAATDGGRKKRRYWTLLSRFALFGKTEPQPQEDVEEVQIDRVLAESTKALPVLECSLIEEKYLRGASIRELAARFQLSEKAVESRLARARHQLRTEIVRRLKHEDSE